MNQKTKRDYWIEMSIRETSTQCHFASIAYNNIDKKSSKPTDMAFSSIHSFLSHCAMVSKMLKAKDKSRRVTNHKTIGQILGISSDSIIHQRTFRNHLEHYDDRLKDWIGKFARGASVGTYNIGPKSMIQGNNFIFVSHYDPSTKVFTFVDRDFNLEELFIEVIRIHKITDEWVGNMEAGITQPPFS